MKKSSIFKGFSVRDDWTLALEQPFNPWVLSPLQLVAAEEKTAPFVGSLSVFSGSALSGEGVCFYRAVPKKKF